MALEDITVLDLTIARAGPTAVRQLADWGASVIRVEAPATGDDFTGDPTSSDYLNLHRNKRALRLDLKQQEGRDIFYWLAERADVMVENFRPPVKTKLGVDYETIAARNPRLVYGSVSGFGQDGPYAEKGAVDQIVQGMGGLMSITGLPGQGPVRVGVAIADLAAGHQLAIGILVAPARASDQWTRPMGPRLAARVDDLVSRLPGDPLDHRRRGAVAGRQRPSHRLPDGRVPDAQTATSTSRHRAIASGGPLCEVLGGTGPLEDPDYVTG